MIKRILFFSLFIQSLYGFASEELSGDGYSWGDGIFNGGLKKGFLLRSSDTKKSSIDSKKRMQARASSASKSQGLNIPLTSDRLTTFNKNLPSSTFSVDSSYLWFDNSSVGGEVDCFLIGTYNSINPTQLELTSEGSTEISYTSIQYDDTPFGFYIKVSALSLKEKETLLPLPLPMNEFGSVFLLPIVDDYTSYEVIKNESSQQYFLSLKESLSCEEIFVPCTKVYANTLSEREITEQLLRSSGYDIESWSLDEYFFNLRELITEKIKNKVDAYRIENNENSWVQSASDEELFAEMHGVWGFSYRSIDEGICFELAKLISTHFEYAPDNILRYKSAKEAIDSGSFQCDFASLLMLSILRDHYKIPSEVIITLPKVLDASTENIHLDCTASLHARVRAFVRCTHDEGPCLFETKIFDPTPKL